MSHAARKLPRCPNCGTDLQQQPNNFCPECGQPNHDVNVTFGHVVEETLEGVFHFDSKVWRTFRELLFQPGKLTVDFLAGRRASFVPPIRLYIFLSVIFFFLLSKHGGTSEKTDRASPQAPAKTGQKTLLRQQVMGQNFGVSLKEPENVAPEAELTFEGGDSASFTFTTTDVKNRPLMERLGSGNTKAIDSFLVARQAQPSWWLRLAVKRFARLQTVEEGEKDHTTLRNLSAGMFILMPLFGLLLKLFYRRQRPLYVQHLIFSVHLHCFFFMLASVFIVLGWVLPATWNMAPAFVSLAWVYWVLSLKRFSGQSFGRTFWKSSLLFGGYLAMIVLFMVSVVLVSLAMF